MSGLDSWEDDPAAQDDNLSRQTQQSLNLNGQSGRGSTFTPNANTFQPGAQSFQPSQQYQQYGGYNQPQYGQYYNQQQQASQYGGYPQYGQQGFGQYNQVYGQQQSGYGDGYGAQYGGYAQQQGYQRQSQQPQQAQQRPTPIIAKRPSASEAPASDASESKPAESGTVTAAPPKAKVLSIGGDTSTPKAKVLTIGATAPAITTTKEAPTAQDGAKVTAAKAMEKVEKKGESPSGKTSPAPSSGKASPSTAEAKAAAREADAVANEQAADVDDEILEEVYGKEHVNLIFIGHVDAGKSTLGGSILYATGMVDERTMDKYKREAKEAGRETWYLSWALDLTKEERAKGKTVEVGRGFFETEKRRYTILDAPGHKTFVPNMIGGASQADIGILVISARKGEYETGFEKGGQTREHAILAKTQGVNQLVVVINKMDDLTVEWSKERYKECIDKLSMFLKGIGYNPKTDLTFMPISAQTTVGIKDRVPKNLAPWHDGPSLLEYLDNLKTLERKVNAPFMMPVNGKYRDMGTIIEGKIEAGAIKKAGTYTMMPNRDEVSVAALYGETEDEIQQATCGDQVRIRVRGVEEEDIMPGFVLCSSKRLVHCVSAFEAQIVLLELKNILSAGFNCVLHVHSAIEEVTFAALLHKLEKGTGRKSKKPPAFAAKGQSIIARLEVIGGAGSICVERFEDYAQLGRFTLRDQGQTIAIGKVTKLITDFAA
ncbi:MAG: putative translation release factor erf3 [Lasallia pustulata]|uniref:Elongation factor 1-alpha n=1 Tax=Lasallia pustulata TaxID=136370 RepID=A0A5M8PV27_9LECA|nr:MAG: putative translation release factor erf3 [Lasallia pustulata]